MTYIDTRELDEELTDLEARDDDEDKSDLLDADETERLTMLRELRDEVGNEWPYGATLIPDSDFTDYAQELAEDIGAISSNYSWPASHIDWEEAAEALQMDYTSVTFDGTDYWVRL